MMRVFIQVFAYVGVEVRKQLVDGRELVRGCLGSDMPMITLAGLIVIAQDAFLPVDQRHAVAALYQAPRA